MRLMYLPRKKLKKAVLRVILLVALLGLATSAFGQRPSRSTFLEDEEEKLPVFSVEGAPHKFGSSLSYFSGIEVEYSDNISSRSPEFDEGNIDLSATSFFYEYIYNRQFGFQLNFNKFRSSDVEFDVSNQTYTMGIDAFSIGFGANIYFNATTRRGFNQVVGVGIGVMNYTLKVDNEADNAPSFFNQSVGGQMNQLFYGLEYIQKLYGFYFRMGLNDGNSFAKNPATDIGVNIVTSGSYFLSMGMYRKL